MSEDPEAAEVERADAAARAHRDEMEKAGLDPETALIASFGYRAGYLDGWRDAR